MGENITELGEQPKLTLLQELERAAEENMSGLRVLQNTQEIEAAIESKPTRTYSRRGFLKWAGALTVATAFGNVLRQKVRGEEKHAVPAILERYPREIIETSSRELGKILDFDPGAFSFEPFKQVKNSKGRYIVHIGQIHREPDPESVVTDSEKVARTQKNIENILEKGKFEAIFVEGVCEENKEIFEYFREVKETMFDPIPPDSKAWQELATNYYQVKEIIEGTKAESLLVVLNYIMIEKIKIFENYFAANPLQMSPEEQDLFSKGYETSKAVEELIFVSQFEDKNFYSSLGAGLKVFIDGKAEIYPAETIEENLQAFGTLDEYQRVFQLMGKTHHPKSVTGVQNELAKESGNFEKQTMTDREEVALELISQHPSFPAIGNFALVYGAAHDFSQEVEKFNLENPDQSIGLIYLAPLTY